MRRKLLTRCGSGIGALPPAPSRHPPAAGRDYAPACIVDGEPRSSGHSESLLPIAKENAACDSIVVRLYVNGAYRPTSSVAKDAS
jgi:hypothetical protein